jgi:hypothetical protein
LSTKTDQTKGGAGQVAAVEKVPDLAIDETILQGIPPAVIELWDLLKRNPTVKIINEPNHYTVLRDGKWVGGRISELVFRVPEVMDYIAIHPAQEIDGKNLIKN